MAAAFVVVGLDRNAETLKDELEHAQSQLVDSSPKDTRIETLLVGSNIYICIIHQVFNISI